MPLSKNLNQLKTKENNLSGFLNVNKPINCSSYSVVDLIKKKYNLYKVGHSGTLDPFASGILILLINKATQKFNDFLDMEKQYIAEILLGVETDTLDITGKIISEVKQPVDLSENDINSVLNKFEGKIKQKPPKFSAKHYKGVRFYDLARKNIDFEIKEQIVEIKKINLLDLNLKENKFVIDVTAKRGVYIRSLAMDIARALGNVGVLNSLKRIRVGNFNINNALDFEKINIDFDVFSSKYFYKI